MAIHLTLLGTTIKRQRGSTLLVALIMLVLLTLIALSAIKSTTTSIQVVGNAQFREEAKAAAQAALEVVMSSNAFKTIPPPAQTITINKSEYIVSFFDPANVANTQPKCTASTAVIPGELGVPGACAGQLGGAAICHWTKWDIRAVVRDVQTGASVVVHQGVKTIASLQDKINAGC